MRRLLYDEETPGTGGGGAVAGETFAGVARADESLIVQIVGALAIGTSAEAALIYTDGIGAHGEGIGVEAVGAFAVVGVERTVERIAIAHDEGSVVTQNICVALVDGVELDVVCLSLIAHYMIVAGTVLRGYGHGDEAAWILQGGGEHRTLMHAVVDAEETGCGTVFIGSVTTGGQSEDDRCCQKQTCSVGSYGLQNDGNVFVSHLLYT